MVRLISKRLIIVPVIIVMLAALVYVPARASQVEGFIVTGDEILPLAEETMPAYYGTNLYLAGSIFEYFGVYTYYNRYDKLFIMEYGKRRLTFYVGTSTAVDEKNEVYSEKAEMVGSLVFVPVSFVCTHFSFSYKTTVFDPLMIVRLKNGREKLNDESFVIRNAAVLKQMYTDYRDAMTTPTPTPPVRTPTAPPTAPPTGRPTATPTPTPTYENISLCFSFYSVTPQTATQIMLSLEQYGMRGAFYVTLSEVVYAPAMVREITGRGHTIGILMTNADIGEYLDTKNAIFEACGVRTPIIAYIPDEAVFGEDDTETGTAETGLSSSEESMTITEFAEIYGLILRDNARGFVTEYSADNLALPKIAGTKAELRMSGADTMWLNNTIRAILERKYNISGITEASEANYDPGR